MTEQVKKTRKKRLGMVRQVRNMKAIEMAMSGMPVKEIAAQLGINRDTVAKVVKNSDYTKQIVKQAEDRIFNLVGKSIDTLEAAIDGRSSDMTNGFKSALAILKSVGVIKDRVDLSHSFPKPTIIKRLNGEEVVLGAQINESEET